MSKSIQKLIKRLQDRQRRISFMDGTSITQKDRIILHGPYLHQDTENMSEIESAKFERDNKLLFDTLRMVREEIKLR